LSSFPGKEEGKTKKVKKLGTISARVFAALFWDNAGRRSGRKN